MYVWEVVVIIVVILSINEIEFVKFRVNVTSLVVISDNVNG